MKLMIKIVILLMVVLTPVMGACMGPIFTGPKTAVWDSVEGSTGYYIYWRTPGTITWPNTQRAATNITSLDLVNAGIPQGTWEICATAIDAVSESGPSNVVTWIYTVKSPPANTKIQ